MKCNGVDARFAVLGGPPADADPEIIIAPPELMSTVEWWRKWDLDGVILYSWAKPDFTPIAAAIKAAGIQLVLILDTDGYVAPVVSRQMYLRNKYYREKENGRFLPFARAAIKTFAASIKSRHSATLQHLELADLLAIPSTLAVQRYSRYLEWLDRPDLAQRLMTIPYPVSERMCYDPSVPKERVIVAVGGWARLQKNTPLLVKVLSRVLRHENKWSATIVGDGGNLIHDLATRLPRQVVDRIRTTGPIANEQLAHLLQRCRISLCTSYHESFHLATAEALCCGCSFVGDVRISSFPFFASSGAGTLSCDLAERHLADALFAEIQLWENGQRDPSGISQFWTHMLHPKYPAEKILRAIRREA